MPLNREHLWNDVPVLLPSCKLCSSLLQEQHVSTNQCFAACLPPFTLRQHLQQRLLFTSTPRFRRGRYYHQQVNPVLLKLTERSLHQMLLTDTEMVHTALHE